MNPLQTPTHIYECAVSLGHSIVADLFMQPNLNYYNKMLNSNHNLICTNDEEKNDVKYFKCIKILLIYF